MFTKHFTWTQTFSLQRINPTISSLSPVETPLPRVTWWSPGDAGVHSRWICVLLYLPLPSSSAAHTSGHAFLCCGATFPALLPFFWTAHTPHRHTLCITDSAHTAFQSVSALRPVIVQSEISSQTWAHNRDAHTDRPSAACTVRTGDWSSIVPCDRWTLPRHIPGISILSVQMQSGPAVSSLCHHRGRHPFFSALHAHFRQPLSSEQLPASWPRSFGGCWKRWCAHKTLKSFLPF